MRPLSWDRLPHLSSTQVLLLDRLSRWLTNGREWSLQGLEPSLGHPLEIRAGQISVRMSRQHEGDLCQLVVLGHAESSRRLFLELDSSLAVELVWLCLNGEVDPSMATPRQLDRVEQGVLLYVVARAIWAVWGRDGPLRVLGCAPSRELDQLTPGSAAVHLEVRAGECAGHAWIHCPSAWWSEASPVATTPRGFPTTGLEALPAAVHVMVGRTTVPLDQLKRAKRGDALIIDEVWARPDEEGVFAQPLRLRLPQGRARWLADLSADGTLCVENPIRSEENQLMDQADDQLPTTPDELLGEIPVELTVELGRIALNAREVTELRPGQPLRFDRRPGDPVEIRVGPKLVARGELVEIEGELGVLLREVFGG